MMNEDKNKNIEFKELLKNSKLTAPENLQYRIMQQIRTENALAKKQAEKASNIRPLLSIIFVLGAILYGVIFAFGALAYKDGGWDSVLSVTYITPIVFVSVICTAYGIISVFDEKRFSRRKS